MEQKTGFIYCVTNPEGKFGIWSSNWMESIIGNLIQSSKNTILQESIKKYGIRSHKITILERDIPYDSTKTRKEEWIEKLKANLNGNFNSYTFHQKEIVLKDVQNQIYWTQTQGQWVKKTKTVLKSPYRTHSNNGEVNRMEEFDQYSFPVYENFQIAFPNPTENLIEDLYQPIK